MTRRITALLVLLTLGLLVPTGAVSAAAARPSAVTAPQLDQVLGQYRRILTQYSSHQVVERAVSVVVSGDRPRALMEAQKVRLAAYDGRLTDLGSGAPASFVPLISSNWNSTFAWQGVGEMPGDQRATLRRIADTAHANGQRVRFWATPDVPGAAREAVWSELLAAGVDHVNTDDLPGLRAFLLAHDAWAAA